MKCALCEIDKSYTYRGATFGGKRKVICKDCLSKFKVHGVEELRVILNA